MILTSLENDRVKDLIKLQRKKYRDLTDTYIVEGEHLIQETYKTGVLIEVYLLEDVDLEIDIPKTYVTLEVMKKISTMDTPPSMIGVCKKNSSHEIVGDKILLLDDIQDPGNLGTIIRSSVAFGVDCIVLSLHTVDLYNPKVLRATQGIYCHIPIVIKDSYEAIVSIKQREIPVYGTNVVDGVDARSLEDDERRQYCLVMGNEGNGVREEIQKICDKNLYIPMKSDVESLNVGIACSILLYELGR